MKPFAIVAHRGITTDAPENTITAFQRAVDLGADAIELDVRLSSDRIPMVFHDYYLEGVTSVSGPIFNYSAEQLREVVVHNRNRPGPITDRIPTLPEVLEQFGGKIGLEIEIKGPEPEAPGIIGNVLRKYKNHWGLISVTSFEPALLLAIQKECPGISSDLLFPLSEPWMKPDVVAYQAIQSARLAQAGVVHLHTTQLIDEVVNPIQRQGIEVHAWDVDDLHSLEQAVDLGVKRICTNNFQQAMNYGARISKT